MPAKIVETTLPFPVFATEADKDYLLARLMPMLGNGLSGRAGYFSHQACEKYMKAFLVQEGQSYPETHLLLELAERCSQYNNYFGAEVVLETLKIFDGFDQVGRYGAAAKYDPLAITEPTFQTKGVMVWQASYMNRLDAFVFNVHSLLNYSKVSQRDQLGAIIDDDRTAALVATWTGPIELSDLLFKNNTAFHR